MGGGEVGPVAIAIDRMLRDDFGGDGMQAKLDALGGDGGAEGGISFEGGAAGNAFLVDPAFAAKPHRTPIPPWPAKA